MRILDGKKVRDFLAEKLSRKIASLPRKPILAIIQVGDREDSNAYIRQKKIFGEKIGAEVLHKKFPENAAAEKIIEEIKKLNKDKNTDGIIVQIPLPEHLDKNKIIDEIDPKKDVDGLTSENMKLLLDGKPRFVPATAKGVLSLLEFYKIPVAGKRTVVVGRSSLVGKPTALALLSKNATVAVCHSKTKNLAEETKRAEILVVAAGKPKLIGRKNVSKGQVIVDVGINVVEKTEDSAKNSSERIFGGLKPETETGSKKFTGDVDFDSVKNIVAAISPVPGGVGPMTVVSLFENLLEAVANR